MHPLPSRICLLFLPALLPGQEALQGDWQDLRLRQAEVLDPDARGIEASVIAGKVVEIVIGNGNRVPLSRPVSDWQIAELPGSVYVILAGGIRESLDLYLYESKSGTVQLIDTDGGRLLSDEFGTGQGSWPRFEGRDLVFFPFEREDKLQLTVVNFQGQVLATQLLPLAVDDYQVQIDAGSQQLRVSFPDRSERLSFLHPSAGRLVLDSGLILFSEAERRSLLLRNEGRRALRLSLSVEGQGFRIIGADQVEIPPRSSREVSLEMIEGADAQARLSISSPVAGASALVGLQNMPALAKLTETVKEEPGKVERGPAPAGRDAPSSAAPQQPEVLAAGDRGEENPARVVPGGEEKPGLSIAHIEMRRLNGELVEVTGFLRSSGADQAEVRVALRNRESGAEEGVSPGSDGSFSLRMPATDEEVIEYGLLLGDQQPEYLVLGPVLPVLKQAGGFLEARAAVDSGLMLLEVSTREGDGLPNRVLRSWRLRVDREGRARVPLPALGEGSGLRSFVLLANSRRGALSQSSVVRVGK